MNKVTIAISFVLAGVGHGAAWGQPVPATAPGATPDVGATPSPPPPPPQPPPPPPPPEAAVVDSPADPPIIERRVDVVEARVEGIDESLAVTRSTAEKLARIKLSGYVQARYERYADSEDGLNAAGNPGDTDRFNVRRGRLKATYDGINAAYEFQIDATGSGVELKQAEATFVDTWTPFRIRLTAGQFKYPFGFEILQSSADREMPERSRVIRRLFPGEHDRGLRLRAQYGHLRFAGAVVNGNGVQDDIYGNTDQNRFKDLVGRVGADFEWLRFGVSGYWGRWLETTEPVKYTIASDANMDGIITADELTTGATPASYRNFARKRLGADAQVTFDFPELGDLELRGEVIWARDTNVAFRAVPADPCLNVTALGWMVTVVQHFGHNLGAVLRLDAFDPNDSGALGAGCVDTDGDRLGVGDRVTTFGGGFFVRASRNLKATLTYEHLSEERRAVVNDVFIAQMQAQF